MAGDKPNEDSGLPLGDIALDMVRRAEDGDEKFVIHPKGPEVLRAAVEAVLKSGEPRDVMKQRFRGVITVCYVLAKKEGSPQAAEILSEALFENAEVIEIMGGREREVRSRGRAYEKFMEGSISLAPSVEEQINAPDDSVKLASFISPGGQDMTSLVRGNASKGPEGSEAKPRKPRKKRSIKGRRRTGKGSRRSPARPPPGARKG